MNSQSTYKGKPSLRVRVFPVFDQHGRETAFTELAKQFSCTESAIRRLWKMYEGEKQRQGKAQCSRCKFFEWEHNPVEEGLCLWCWADITGTNLQRIVERDGWGKTIAAFQNDMINGGAND